METHTADHSIAITCHACGYDVRMQPADGRCPECGASVADAREAAKVPIRPDWRDSDPRWRRRIIAGAWVLVLLPLVDALKMGGWLARLPALNVIDYRGTLTTFDQTMFCYADVHLPLWFCIGIVLLFAKERGRRRGRLDWTRRWGVICSYIIMLLGMAPTLFLSALVVIGIGALFQSMPLKYQPPATAWFVKVGSAYLRYGPNPQVAASVVLAAFSSIVMLLACVPLFDALRSSGPKRAAATLLAPLAGFSILHLAQVGFYSLRSSNVTSIDIDSLVFYFRPELLIKSISGLHSNINVSGPVIAIFLVEIIKWLSMLAIAIWLTIAQIASWRRLRPMPR